jgi:molybdate/tungstate transport system permease protein
MRRKIDRTMLISGALGAVAVVFIGITIGSLFVKVGFAGLGEALQDNNALTAILLSMGAAFYATVLSIIFGVPLAYFLARNKFFGKRFVESIIDLPIVVPHIVAGIALLTVFGANGFIGAPLDSIGIHIADSMGGIVLAMMFVSAPFIINSAKSGFEAVDPRLENVAMGLGASRLRAVLTVTVPLSSRSLFNGAVMTWARAISEFGAVVIIAYYPMAASTYIYSTYLQYGLDRSLPVAALLLLICIIIFISLRTISARWKPYDSN